MRSIDSQKMREENRRFFLHLLWQHEEISRADLSRLTGMSRSAVSDIVGELLNKNLIVEKGSGQSCGGRRPIILQMNEDMHYMLGLEIGASHIELVLLNLRGKILGHERVSITTDDKPFVCLELAMQKVGSLGERCGVAQKKLVGMGIALASPVHPQAEYITMAAEIRPAWRDIDIAAYFRQRMSTPVFIDNDANLGALAEVWWGQHGHERDSLVFIKLGTGFGAGFVIHGQIVAGSLGLAGEIGHMVIDKDSELSLQGLAGCLAAYSGSRAILKRAKQLLADDPSSQLAADHLDIDQIVVACQQDDPLAQALVREIGQIIGIGVANLIHLLNPGTIILGGRFAEAGPCLYEAIRAELQRRVLWPALAKTPIAASSLSSKVIAVGAATQVLQQILNGNLLQSEHFITPSALAAAQGRL